MKNNMHLVPINVIDIVERLYLSKNENEALNYTHRLEVIRDYCSYSIDQYTKKVQAKQKNIKR